MPKPSLDRLFLWVLAAVSATFSALWAIRLHNVQPPFVDFLPLWTAGGFALNHPDRVYDFTAVSQAQVWLLQTVPTPRPFVYPPTALIWLAPLARMPFWIAAWTWTAAGVALFLTATWRLARSRSLVAGALSVTAPVVVIALIAGQSDLITGGLTLIGVEALTRRPRLAGLCLALAASLKPQMAPLAPVALIACGAYEALISAGVASLAIVGASLLGFGWERWPEWLGVLSPFQDVVAHTPNLASFSLSPIELAQGLGAPKAWLRAASLVMDAVAVGIVWIGFRRVATNVAERGGLLLGAGLVASPYALAYDGAPLVSSAVALAIATPAFAGLWRLAPLAAVTAMALPWTGPWDVLAFVVILLASPRRRPSQ